MPGPLYPDSLDSILKPIISEMYDLATNGMIVKSNGEDIHVKVHALNVKGDIQGNV
jgi:hypothetical protein